MLNFDNSSTRFFVQTNSDDNVEFVNRQKSVFEKLDAVVKDKEKNIEDNKTYLKCEDTERKSNKRQRYDTRQFQGKESIFKRPEAPPPPRFKRKLPDYVKNPQKWTKYTLSDVSPDDMSDHSNTAAAMSFLRELKAKKESENMDVDKEVKQVTFKKPSSYKKQDRDDTNAIKYESPSFRSSKVVMPEYVVGEKKVPKKSTPKPLDKKEKRKEIKLDHLNEEEEF